VADFRHEPDLGPSEIDEAVPAPLLMNCWKHHGPTVLARIDAAVAGGEAAVRALPARLLQLGDALMDLYLGRLPLATIAAEVLAQLRARAVLEPAAFADWVGSGGGYRTLELSDGSRWVLRASPVAGRHVHIHPARHSPHSIRAVANAFRSAIVALAWARQRGGDPFDVALYNDARRLLELPPVGSIGPDDGVGELMGRLLACARSGPPPGGPAGTSLAGVTADSGRSR
jgi:hypothetical protein